MQKQLGKYKIVEQIGAGKFGIVYSAQDTEIGRLVALKVLRPEGFASTRDKALSVKRFSTEMRAAGRLNHPNICAVFDSGITDDGLPYLVMQLVDGKPLDLVLRDLGGAMESNRALHILYQLGEALDFAHSKNVIHRDLKPSNIILTGGDRPYILDFSAAFLSDSSLIEMDTVAGTPQYMSPEVIQGGQPTASADLYSLGILAYVLFTGSRPFRDGDIRSTLEAIIKQSAFSFAELGCPLGARLERVLRRSLAKNPEDRYSNAKEFVAACSDALNNRSTKTFSQVAVRNADSGDPSASIFIKDQQKVIKSSIARSALMLIVKTVLVSALIIILALLAVLGLTDKYSATHQTVASIFNLQIKSAEINSLNDKQLSLLLSSQFPLQVKLASLQALENRNLEPFVEFLSGLISDPDPEVRFKALSFLTKVSDNNIKLLEQNLQFALSDQDRFVRIYAFLKLLNNKESHSEILTNKISTEKDIAVQEILQKLLNNSQKTEASAPAAQQKKKK